MIIDFHTHAFPDKIAEKTIDLLAAKAGITPYCNGTLSCLKRSMADAGVDISVVLPIATRSGQEQSILNFATEINGKDGIVSFASVHPDTENFKEVLDAAKENGIVGIKLHPDYQGFYIDDIKTYKIVEYAAKLDMTVVYHAGVDLGFRDNIRNTPVRARKMINEIGYNKIVLAHMGGNALYGDVLECLCGLNVYFDISFTLGRADDKIVKEIINAHGADKILFGTDNPWGSQKNDLQHFDTLGFSDDTKEKILYKNALRLLDIR